MLFSPSHTVQHKYSIRDEKKKKTSSQTSQINNIYNKMEFIFRAVNLGKRQNYLLNVNRVENREPKLQGGIANCADG